VFHLVFFVVVLSSLVPGATVGAAARWLGIARAGRPAQATSIEVVSLRDFPGEFVWYAVDAVSMAAGAQVKDLSLPTGCLVTLVVRGHEVVVPRGTTLLQPGDQVCAFVTPESRSLLDLLFGTAEDEGA